ncbi:heat shock cognate 90 kDa protein [Naviculisporaceae sp. PSN 640]
MDYAKLRAAALRSSEEEEAVTVDTRALIDKVLARYSGEWTTLRELTQNAADAQATTVKIKWETLPSTHVPLPTTTSQSELLKHTLSHHTLRRLVVQNNGQPFTKTDWGRLKRIAEGNPDETKIGAFGVGFYSVFADCEEPFVSSGKEAMAFYWKGNALFTRKLQVPREQASSDTAFVLDYRNTTTPMPNLLSVAQFLATSLTFIALQNIEFWIDDWKVLALQKKTSPSVRIHIPRDLETKTKDGLMSLASAERTSVQIDATFMSALGWKPHAVSADSYTSSEAPSLRSFFSRLASSTAQAGLRGKAAKEEQAVQDAIAEDLTATSTSSIFLRVTSAQIKTSVPAKFAAELERATKKPPPKTTKISILTSSYDETIASEESSVSNKVAKAADVFSSVLPSKKPGGRIFIGFPTAQTTGAGMHISAPSIIPTVEREAIDLNARWVSTWNVEMLRVAGVMSRLAYANEMSDLEEKLKRMAKANKGSAISAADVQKLIPEALHILKTYTFEDSTPISKVAQTIEEAFWTAYKRASIEVYSSRGVLPTTKVRSSSDEIVKFARGIPVVIPEMKEAPFMKKLSDLGLIQDISVDDIYQELSANAMDKDQLRHFIAWAAKSASTGEIDPPSRRRLLDAAIATISDGDESGGSIVALASIKNYQSNKIPVGLPIPPTTISITLVGNISEVMLRSLGWEPLSIATWMKFVIDTGSSRSADQDMTRSPDFSGRVLSVASKNWDSLSETSKASIVTALQDVAAIPTKMGMRKPGEAFFPSVKLFDDLPTLKSGLFLKDPFLAALGVRKTVDLDTIFTRLLNPSPDGAVTGHKKWSHMELIKYLTSVRNDIPAADMEKLKESKLCPAEAGPPGLEPTEGSARLYKVSELYKPNNELRGLKLPIIYWPEPRGGWRYNSAEAKFLEDLGLRAYPPVLELVDMMAGPDATLRTKAMTYFISSYFHYNSVEVGRIDKAFLPLEGKPDQLVAPGACYTNQDAAVLGYDILASELHRNAHKFGVARDPVISDCVARLLANPPKDRKTAISVFTYFQTRLGDLDDRQVATLKQAPIVPIKKKTNASLFSKDKAETAVVYVQPQNCYLGSSATYGNIFDFVDFGTGANTFLFKCGAKSQPTTVEIAQMACEEPARLLSVLQSPEKYLDLLRTLAEDLPELKSNKELFKKMKTSAWLLGSKEIPVPKSNAGPDKDEDEATVKSYQLATPRQIVILDDYISYRLFKQFLIGAPEEDSLEAFYQALGSGTLGMKIEEDVRIGAHAENQDGAQRLRQHVLERTKIFLHEYSKFKHDAIKHDEKWLDKNLQVVAVRTVLLRRSLRGHDQSHNEKRSAAISYHKQRWVLYVAEGRPDMYQVGQAICQVVLKRPSQQAYINFEPFLKLDLLDLRSRGYNVDRILRAKAAEARIAEEERLKALEAEQQKIKEREQEWKRAGEAAATKTPEEAAATKTPEPKTRMPGSFADSPEEEKAVATPSRPQTKPGGIFAQISRHLGLEPWEDPKEPTRPVSAGSSHGSPDTTHHTGGRVSSPAAVQQNLYNAITSTRAYDSSHLYAPPRVQKVKEQATYCDSTTSKNITYLADAPGGMRVFLAEDIRAENKTRFLTENGEVITHFERLLRDVGEIYGLSAKSMHIFYDESGHTIAFNMSGSIFCNLRYFQQLHWESLRRGGSYLDARVKATTWWWVVVAHELAHNLMGPHNAEHSYYTECFIQEYFGKMMAKAAQWTRPVTNSTTAPAPAAGSSSGNNAPQPPLRPRAPPPPYSARAGLMGLFD